MSVAPRVVAGHLKAILTGDGGPRRGGRLPRPGLATAAPLQPGSAEEVTQAALFLAGDASAFPTGALLAVSGGRFLREQRDSLAAGGQGSYKTDRRAKSASHQTGQVAGGS